MGYGQHIRVILKNQSTKNLVLKNGNLSWGKWYDGDNKDNEVSFPTNKVVQSKGGQTTVSSCGRSDAASGCTGSFEVFDEAGTQVCEVTWNCPWGAKQNDYQVKTQSDRYIVTTDTTNLYGGAIGDRTVSIMENPASQWQAK
jgi:hypothetical protein